MSPEENLVIAAGLAESLGVNEAAAKVGAEMSEALINDIVKLINDRCDSGFDPDKQNDRSTYPTEAQVVAQALTYATLIQLGKERLPLVRMLLMLHPIVTKEA